nr:MAG TPA: hypothetical protein [Caudoviricetes sp.]
MPKNKSPAVARLSLSVFVRFKESIRLVVVA